MKKYVVACFVALASASASAADVAPDAELTNYLSPAGPLSAEQLQAVRGTPWAAALNLGSNNAGASTYTYLRCYYRLDDDLRKPATTYAWARATAGGDYYRVNGSWWAGGALRWQNMFYSDVTQDSLRHVCESTLADQGIKRPVAMFLAANNQLSYNYTVWSNDVAAGKGGIDRVIAFGDSLSDTQNMYNASAWKLPNATSWYVGHFSNGPVWTEYLAQELKLPHYDWAVGGAAGDSSYLVLPGLIQEVDSWHQYMQKASGYRPENTLFTVLIGGNDLVNYSRNVDQIVADATQALERIIADGGRHIVLLNLPDVSRAPVFKDRQDGAKVAAQVLDYNAKLAGLVERLRVKHGAVLDLRLFDTHTLFNDMFDKPAKYKIANTGDACLNIDQPSSMDYVQRHDARASCGDPNTFVFWDTMHPTTGTHKLLAAQVSNFLKAGN